MSGNRVFLRLRPPFHKRKERDQRSFHHIHRPARRSDLRRERSLHRLLPDEPKVKQILGNLASSHDHFIFRAMAVSLSFMVGRVGSVVSSASFGLLLEFNCQLTFIAASIILVGNKRHNQPQCNPLIALFPLQHAP